MRSSSSSFGYLDVRCGGDVEVTGDVVMALFSTKRSFFSHARYSRKRSGKPQTSKNGLISTVM